MKCQQIPYIDCHANDALDQISCAEFGVHYIIIYPDLFTLRELYSAYVQNTLRRIEIILLNPFYETTDSVRHIFYRKGLNMFKYEREKVLEIIDSLKEYFSQQPDMDFKRCLANYSKRIMKNGLSILGDIGVYPHKSKYDELVV